MSLLCTVASRAYYNGFGIKKKDMPSSYIFKKQTLFIEHLHFHVLCTFYRQSNGWRCWWLILQRLCPLNGKVPEGIIQFYLFEDQLNTRLQNFSFHAYYRGALPTALHKRAVGRRVYFEKNKRPKKSPENMIVIFLTSS